MNTCECPGIRKQIDSKAFSSGCTCCVYNIIQIVTLSSRATREHPNRSQAGQETDKIKHRHISEVHSI